MNLTIKTVIMLMITSAAAIIAETGIPQGIEWAILGVSVFGTSLVHIGQSLALPTNTAQGDINFRDLLKGGIVALGNFLAQFAASYIPGAIIDWSDMINSAAMVFIMYCIKQLATNKTLPAASPIKK